MKHTLKQSIEIVKYLNKELESYYYSVGLTGSTLFHGYSKDDIDIIIYPLKTLVNNYPTKLILNILEGLFQGKASDRTVFHEEDTKIVYKIIGLYKNKEVTLDFFFLS